MSADYQSRNTFHRRWVIKSGRLLLAKNQKECGAEFAKEAMTSHRSLVKVAHKNHENGTYTINNYCGLKGKQNIDAHWPRDICLDVREPNITDKFTTLGLAPKYLFWNQTLFRGELEPSGACKKYFYITAAYDNEQDMFNIFYKQDNHFYSPSCCVVSSDNVNVPFVDNGLTMCKCWESDISIIKDKPVINKGLFDHVKKLLH